MLEQQVDALATAIPNYSIYNPPSDRWMFSGHWENIRVEKVDALVATGEYISILSLKTCMSTEDTVE